jgi:hypothetical protein
MDLPGLTMFPDRAITPISVEPVGRHDSSIGCTWHLIDVLQEGGQPVLDGSTGKAVLQFTVATSSSRVKTRRGGRTI